jgi:acyl dehydratase
LSAMADVLHSNAKDRMHQLLSWEVGDATHTFTRRETAFYALSIGMGQDAADVRQHRYVDPWSADLKAAPTMALVLGYPGFWLGTRAVSEATGVMAHEVLHVEQSIDFYLELPVEGTVVGRTRITGIADKGEARGCLLYSQRDIFDADSGVLIASCRQVHYLKGHGGCGSMGSVPTPLDAAEPAHDAHDVVLETRPEQALIYRLNGDANAIHFDPETARRAGLPRPILHGMATLGFVGHAILKKVDYEYSNLKEISMRMTAPVFPGDTLVTRIGADGAFQCRVAQRGVIAGAGTALMQSAARFPS